MDNANLNSYDEPSARRWKGSLLTGELPAVKLLAVARPPIRDNS